MPPQATNVYSLSLLLHTYKRRCLNYSHDDKDDLSVDCDGTADGETYARLGRCLEAPNFNILSNNNRQERIQCSTFNRQEECISILHRQTFIPYSTSVKTNVEDRHVREVGGAGGRVCKYHDIMRGLGFPLELIPGLKLINTAGWRGVKIPS